MKKGFTLVELLGVVTILAILLLMGTATISKIVKENRTDMYNKQIDSFKESAYNWAMANTNKLPDPGNSIRITLEDLIRENLVKDNIKNPLTDEIFDKSEYFCIKNINGQYDYIHNGDC